MPCLPLVRVPLQAPLPLPDFISTLQTTQSSALVCPAIPEQDPVTPIARVVYQGGCGWGHRGGLMGGCVEGW